MVLLAASPRTSENVGATIYAFNTAHFAATEAIQEIELKFTLPQREFRPSLARLLPRFSSSREFVHIRCIDREMDTFLCMTTQGTYYIFSYANTGDDAQ